METAKINSMLTAGPSRRTTDKGPSRPKCTRSRASVGGTSPRHRLSRPSLYSGLPADVVAGAGRPRCDTQRLDATAARSRHRADRPCSAGLWRAATRLNRGDLGRRRTGRSPDPGLADVSVQDRRWLVAPGPGRVADADAGVRAAPRRHPSAGGHGPLPVPSAGGAAGQPRPDQHMEKTAWSGVVQSRLQRRHGIVIAAVLTAIPFVLAHLPLHFIGDFTPGSLLTALMSLLIVCTLVRLMIGVFLRGTHGSILAVALLHTMFNRSNNDEGLVAALLEGDGRKLAGLLAVLILTATIAYVSRRLNRPAQPIAIHH